MEVLNNNKRVFSPNDELVTEPRIKIVRIETEDKINCSEQSSLEECADEGSQPTLVSPELEQGEFQKLASVEIYNHVDYNLHYLSEDNWDDETVDEYFVDSSGKRYPLIFYTNEEIGKLLETNFLSHKNEDDRYKILKYYLNNPHEQIDPKEAKSILYWTRYLRKLHNKNQLPKKRVIQMNKMKNWKWHGKKNIFLDQKLK